MTSCKVRMHSEIWRGILTLCTQDLLMGLTHSEGSVGVHYIYITYRIICKNRYTSHSQQFFRAMVVPDGICLYTSTLHKSQGNDSFRVRWNRQIYRWTDLSMTIIYWWLTFVTDLLDLATYQFWSIISSPNFQMHSNLTSNRCLCAFYEGIFNMHSNLIYIKWNQKFTGKLDIYIPCHHPVAFVLLFWKQHGFEIKRREKLPSNTFPILSAWRKYQKQNSANWC